MGNTGKKIILTIKAVYTTSGQPAPLDVKDNVPGQEGYIEPAQDMETCPINADLTCPVVQAKVTSGRYYYEFSLLGGVLNNPNIKKVKVLLTIADVVMIQHEYMLPQVNYFQDSFAQSAGSYDLKIQYLDINDTVLATCSGPTLVIP